MTCKQSAEMLEGAVKFIEDYTVENGEAPKVQDVAVNQGVSVNTVLITLKVAVERGLLTYHPNKQPAYRSARAKMVID